MENVGNKDSSRSLELKRGNLTNMGTMLCERICDLQSYIWGRDQLLQICEIKLNEHNLYNSTILVMVDRN